MSYITSLLIKVFGLDTYNPNRPSPRCHNTYSTMKELNHLLENGDISDDTKTAIALVMDYVNQGLESRAPITM